MINHRNSWILTSPVCVHEAENSFSSLTLQHNKQVKRLTKSNRFMNAKWTKYWPKKGISRMFFGLFFTFSFFFFFEVLVFTHLMCACTCCRDPKQIFVSLPISLARGLKKYILSWFFFPSLVLRWKQERTHSCQLEFLSWHVRCLLSAVMFFTFLVWSGTWVYECTEKERNRTL